FAGLAKLHWPDLDYVGYKMAQQVLDTVPEGGRGGGAARASAFHVEVYNAFLVAAEGYVATGARHRRTHARLDQILDGGAGLHILGEKNFSTCSCRAFGSPRRQRPSEQMVLNGGAEWGRLHLRPSPAGLGHGDKMGTEKNTADVGNVKEAGR